MSSRDGDPTGDDDASVDGSGDGVLLIRAWTEPDAGDGNDVRARILIDSGDEDERREVTVAGSDDIVRVVREFLAALRD